MSVKANIKKVIYATLFIFILLHSINIISHFLILDRTSYEPIFGLNPPFSKLLFPWLNYDGHNYLRIILYGYDMQSVVFFPLFPIIVKIFSLNGVLNQIIMGLGLSFLFTLFATLGLFLLTRVDYGEKVALRTVFLFITFPTFFFMFAYYAESLFLLISILFFWFLKKGNYFLASCCILLASITKIFALALIVPLIMSSFSDKRFKEVFTRWMVVGLSGFILYFSYVAFRFGDPALILKVQSSERFSRQIGILGPVNVAQDTVSKVISGPHASYDSVFVYPIIIFELIAIIFGLVVLAASHKKIATNYWIYCFAYILIIIFSGGLSSDSRYMLMLFPFIIFLAKSLSEFWYKVWMVLSLSLMLFLSSLFFRNYWVA